MTHYTMPARSQGNAFMQRTANRLEGDDVHRWVFVRNLAPDVDCDVRHWLTLRLNGLYCDLQLNNTPLSISSMSRNDEAVEVDARGLNARDAVKTLTKATGLNPHMSVYGWPFCLSDLNDAHTGGGAV